MMGIILLSLPGLVLLGIAGDFLWLLWKLNKNGQLVTSRTLKEEKMKLCSSEVQQMRKDNYFIVINTRFGNQDYLQFEEEFTNLDMKISKAYKEIIVLDNRDYLPKASALVKTEILRTNNQSKQNVALSSKKGNLELGNFESRPTFMEEAILC